MGIAQTRYSVKFRTLYKIIQLKLLWNSARDYKICKKKKIQGLLSTLTQKVLFFKDFKALKKHWWNSSTFKHFKDLYEPWVLVKDAVLPLLNFQIKYNFSPNKVSFPSK